MQRAPVAVALIILSCAACATVEEASTDTRLVEAQEAFHRGEKELEAGKYAEAVPLLERALQVRESILGGAHPDVANCLDLLGEVYRLLADHAHAEPLLQRALEIREAALGTSHPDVAQTLNNLALLYKVQGLYARAEPLYVRALEIREAALGQNHPEVSTSLNNLALLYESQGLYSRAEPLLERALEIREAALGENHPAVASTASNLALLYESQGLYSRAEPLLERALKIQKAALGENHPSVAQTLNNLAALYSSQGLYARAEPLYARALEIWEAALGKNHPEIANSLNNLALLYKTQGFYTRAEPLYARALKIREATLGQNHPDVATSLNNLASLYAAQGFYTRAEPLHARALEIREAALGQNHPDVATSLNNLALLYRNQGLYARAEPLLERALKTFEAAFGESHPVIATALNNLASLHGDQGLYARAEPLHARALKIREAALGGDHPDVAISLHNLASLYREQGFYARAEPLYARALEIREAGLGKNHPAVTDSLHNLAQLQLAQQHLDAALPLLDRAFTTSEEHLRQEVFGFSEVRLASVLHQLRAKEDLLYTLVRAHPGDARVLHLALSAALLRKGRSVQELANTSLTIYRNLGPTDRETFERLRAVRTQLATFSLAGPGKLSARDHQQRLKELADKGDSLEVELARSSEPFRRLRSLPSPTQLISHVTSALPSSGALVEFVAYQDRPFLPRPGLSPSQGDGGLRYLALLLFPDGSTRAVDLGLAAPIDRAVLRLHGMLARQSVSYQPAAQALYELAFRPLVPHLGKVRRLFLAPDGQLNLVPFAALHDGHRFLVDAFDITYLTSGKDLLPRSKDLPPARSVLVLADPDFSSPPAAPSPVARADTALTERSASLERFFSTLRSERADLPWTPLPGTRKEAEAIQRLFPQAQLLLGPDATKQALLKLSTPGVLHIATHGFFLEDAPSSPDSRAVSHFGAVSARPQAPPADPLLRSGLVLAGAPLSAASPGPRQAEDSLATALELAGLNLWGTQLVVLSACDTGRGDVKLGQGVYGLRRAFLVAGAETLVTSLWKVNDGTTHQLMEAYYRHLLAGLGRTAALREAMRELRRKRPHPHFWAPFIALGLDVPLRAQAMPGEVEK